MIKNIFFDLDGTLLNMDTKLFIEKYYEGLSQRIPNEDMYNLIETGIKRMYQNDGSKSNSTVFWESLGRDDLKSKMVDFYANEFIITKESCSPIGRVPELLRKLRDKGYRLFLTTNPIFPREAILERIRWAGLYPSIFEYITDYENSSFTKPNPLYFKEVIDYFKLNPLETIMIGNDCVEDLAARKLGIKCFIRTDSLINSDIDFEADYKGSFNDLYDFLNQLPKLDLCWCGSNKKYDLCHKEFDLKLKSFKDKRIGVPNHAMIKNQEEIEGIRKAGLLNTHILDCVEKIIRPGLSTLEIDRLVYKETIINGGIPAPLNYEGFPKSCCVSINDMVCHGIPSKKIYLHQGDIVNVDCTTILNGYFADASRTFIVGKANSRALRLVKTTKEALDLCIKSIKPYMRLGDIGGIITEYAHKNGYSVVRECTGHGVGRMFHEEPEVMHYGRRNTGMLITPGMVFTIEPMINEGRREVYIDADNEWTIYTDDGLLSAQFEYTVLVTEDGLEILSY